ncbi:MAG: GPW/gp25 family protein [Dehalococcoidia bacterium]|nr:MAG: baseplate protein [bacterium]MCE7928759.1 baseplate protein [Chloroflexi bacterium CFX7]MCK6564040.1 GPW/gp25 family protein [Dehalococcoidia bacterium]NUQ56353.1 GPW/gp25 family protein [Dehalococcoidia bacterium]RIL03310.1 MAG: baseplate protein [bacterium]
MPGNVLVGRGWTFPVQIGGSGGISLSGDASDIEEAVRVIIGTSPGERVMRPDFGCRIHELVFAPANSQTVGLAQRYVLEALKWWEPRIEVIEVSGMIDTVEPNRLLINVIYTIRDTKDERSLVYPFYLIARE